MIGGTRGNKRGLDAAASIIIMILFAFIFLGGTYILLLMPTVPVHTQYIPYSINISQEELGNNSIQFFPNLRYDTREISYSINSSCDSSRRQSALDAFSILQGETILRFTEVDDGSALIDIACAEVSPSPEQKGYFVAGEGGPEKIVDTGKFNLIISGKVALYRPEKCQTPQVATHEILHALGFDHNNNTNSIMYPVTGCNQKIDKTITDEINRIYAVDSLPDLAIENASAIRDGKYLNFSIIVTNEGLVKSGKFKLNLVSNNKTFDSFDSDELDAGTKQVMQVENLKLPSNFDGLSFVIDYNGKELAIDNNVAVLAVLSR